MQRNHSTRQPGLPADLILRNGQIYTMDEAMPWASAVAITGNVTHAVFRSDADADSAIGGRTQVIDLQGRFALPGFVDSHVHLASAGALLNGANLLPVSDDAALCQELGRVVDLLEPGEWITDGLWGAYEQWQMGAAAANKQRSGRWMPSRQVIDDISPMHPVFVRSYDGVLYLANERALQMAGVESQTGLLHKGSPAIERLQRAVTPKSERRRLDELRAALKGLRESGITEVHDITNDANMQLYVKLQEAGELTTRIWMRPDLARAEEFRQKSVRIGTHPVTGKLDSFLRWGAFKGYIDGIMGNYTALFFEPYSDRPSTYGRYRHHTSDDPNLERPNMAKIADYLLTAWDAGFPTNVHAIGDKGVALMLDTYEDLMRQSGQQLRGYRIIHGQVVRPQDLPRFQDLGVIAEVNPYHLSDDMRWMAERIGHERCRGAYAFRSLLDNGAELVFGSDWGGSPAAYYELHPKYLIHAAVNRTTLHGEPPGGWFPDERISVEQALRAYTVNAAHAALDGDIRGVIGPGKLADITVLDGNPLEAAPEEMLDMQVVMTIVDGEIVFPDMPDQNRVASPGDHAR